jgi:hypothetical protein
MPRSKKGLKHHNSVHVKSSEDLVDLHDFLKKNKKGIFIVVVMMDGCPHCVTLDRDIVDPLLNNPSRRAGIAKIQHTELENSPLKSLSDKIRGYPTVIKVENGTAEEVEDPRNLAAMEETVGATAENALSVSKSIDLDESANEARDENVMNAENISSLLEGSMKEGSKKVRVPAVNKDVSLNSQNPESMETEFKAPKYKGAVGGSLYASLLEAGSALAPAAILTTAAVASRIVISRKAKKGKRSKRSRRRKN